MKNIFLIILIVVLLSIKYQTFSQILNEWEFIDTTENLSTEFFQPEIRISGVDENDFVIICGKYSRDVLSNRYIIKKYSEKGNKSEIIYIDTVNVCHRFYSIAHPSKNLIVIVGDTNEYIGSYQDLSYKSFGMLMKSTNGGKTWVKNILDSNKQLRKLSMCDSLNGIILQADFFNFFNQKDKFYDSLLITNDGWITYDKIAIPEDADYIKNAICLNKNEFYLLCESEPDFTYFLYITNDKGKTWKKSMPIGPGNIIVNNIKVLNDKKLFITANRQVKKIGQDYEPVILKSEDNGYSWKECKNVFNEKKDDIFKMKSIDFCDSLNGIAVGTEWTILRTSDGGETWSKEYTTFIKPPNTNFDFTPFNIFFPINDFIIILCNEKGILKCVNKKILSKPKFYYINNYLFQPINNVNVKWTTVDGARYYHVKIDSSYIGYRNYDVQFENPLIDTILTDASYTMNNLVYDYNYKFFVKAIGDSIESDWCRGYDGFGSFRTKSNEDELYSPEIIYPPYASRVETSNITLLWNKVLTADRYTILIENNKNSEVINESITDTTFYLTNLIPGAFYYITLKSYKGAKGASSSWSYFARRDILGIEDEFVKEEKSELLSYPTPFSSSFNIEFVNKTRSSVTTELYDILGNKIYSKNLGFLDSGTHNTTIQLNDNFSPGCYLVVIRSGADVQSMKVVKSE